MALPAKAMVLAFIFDFRYSCHCVTDWVCAIRCTSLLSKQVQINGLRQLQDPISGVSNVKREGSQDVDWDRGLPLEVLALVAKAGGTMAMKGMRGASRTWQQGFDLGVAGIGIFDDTKPVLTCGACILYRPPHQFPRSEVTLGFPGLPKLDLGQSAIRPAWLKKLKLFPRLDILIHGLSTYLRGSPSSLALHLSDFHMLHLRVCLIPKPTPAIPIAPRHLVPPPRN